MVSKLAPCHPSSLNGIWVNQLVHKDSGMRASLHPTKKYFLVMFMISCLLLEVFTAVIYSQSRLNKNSDDWLIHSYELLRIARLVIVDAFDLASQERGYLFTGDFSYLSDYRTTVTDLDKNIAILQKETSDNPEQHKNIDTLNSAIKHLEQVSASHLDTLQAIRSSDALLKGSVVETQRTMANVRSSFEKFNEEETQLLDARKHDAYKEQNEYWWTLFMGAVLGLGALLIANLAIFLLLTKNTRAEDKLRKTESLFSIVLSGINDGIFDYNFVNGTIHYSESYKAMLGYSAKELDSLPENLFTLIHPDDQPNAREVFEQYKEQQIDTYNNVFRMRHKDGHWLWVLARGVGVWDETGKNLQRLIGAHTDITIQKQREEELKYFIEKNQKQHEELIEAKEKAEAANQSKSDFLAAMSHEIRTPMNAVVGLTQLLCQTPLSDKQFEMVETLGINADILLHLVNDQLDISRIESGQVELEVQSFTFESICKMIHAIFNGQASAKGLVLSITNNVGHQAYIGDKMRLQQILINLVGNALKFTPQGSISITFDGEEASNGFTHIYASITDTGIGIAPEKIPVIFDKYIQADKTISRRFGGSGLGLALCKSMAQLMGGDIDIASTSNKGSTFKLFLPFKKEDQKKHKLTAVPSAPTAEIVPFGNEILVVEDYFPNVMVITMMLENMGYIVDVARCGTVAIDKVKERAKPYVAILMDVQMHDMDGFEATRRIRAIEENKGFRHIIIGVTAHALAGDRERCMDAGMNDYMSKPVNPELLEQKLSLSSKAA
jgi:PAS domain S-box-containing protein